MFQDKLLEEMWKQQDSLEAPPATAAKTPASTEAGGGSEENSKDGNLLLERLRALEVKSIAGSTAYPPFLLSHHPFLFIPEMYAWNDALRLSHDLNLFK